jgi:hypothetical protein
MLYSKIVMYLPLYNLLCCLLCKWHMLLTVSHAHIKHDLNVVVYGSWVLGLALLYLCNQIKKSGWIGLLFQM